MNIFKRMAEKKEKLYKLRDNLCFAYRDYIIMDHAPKWINHYEIGKEPKIGELVTVIEDDVFVSGYTCTIVKNLEETVYIVLKECVEQL